ncbi:hypothetical protein QOZ88_02900 [Blastococcus sp. BMG 814]|uniref:Phage baseplate protein n=1 Tax=Blastococcus carthaginiensis TaxID=3050034 RepID=A0ABT9I7P7_9ACTN|nr:hypothetical protein [Blastococcus carthaginiensis]MDP5181573.1 hypothetical protein [Blastococcus carthaginiensis]
MATLDDAAHLLDVWDAGASVSGVMQDVVVLHAAGVVADLDGALDLGVDEVAALAAGLYAEAFGNVVEGVIRCHRCGDLLDVPLPLSAVLADPPGAAGPVESPVGDLAVRAPTLRDLVLAGRSPDPATALWNRCVTRAGGEPVDASAFGTDVLAQVDAVAERLAGLAALVVTAPCPACGADLRAPVDVSQLLWQRICVAAPALLAEVATLAAAFGWTERDVLALSVPRRRAYLDLVGAGVR